LAAAISAARRFPADRPSIDYVINNLDRLLQGAPKAPVTPVIPTTTALSEDDL
jgi:hypothetical protein